MDVGGRPRYYETPESMQTAIDEYFIYINGETKQIKQTVFNKKKDINEDMLVTEWARYPEPATITGLIIFLGFSHREALIDYEKRDGFSDTIKMAKLRVECEYEKKLSGDKPTGPIFALKNMGWRDKQEIEHSGEMSINFFEEKTYETKPKTD